MRGLLQATLLLLVALLPLRSEAKTKPPATVAVDVAPSPLVVATHRVPPFVIKNPDGSWSGISIDLWKRVAEELKLPYVIREFDIPDFDKPEENGMDVVVSLNITARREAMMDLTHAFYSTGLAIAARPEPKNGLGDVIGKVLTVSFLKGVGVLFLVIILMGCVVWRIERRSSPEDFGGHALRGIVGGMFWTVESLVGKSKGLSRTRAARLLTLGWVFVCTMMVSGVTAKLSSELTVSQLSTSVSGPNDLPKVRVGSMRTSLGARYLELRGIPFKEYEEVTGALDALAKGEIDAVVYEAPILQYHVNKSYPKVTVLPGTFLNHGYGFGLRSGSPLRERINVTMLKLVEQDDWKQILTRYLGTAG
jgi:ABC-type amino acid transport substrate-binding protein